MRAMWLGFGASIVIAVLAAVMLEYLGHSSSAERFSEQSVRLDSNGS